MLVLKHYALVFPVITGFADYPVITGVSFVVLDICKNCFFLYKTIILLIDFIFI